MSKNLYESQVAKDAAKRFKILCEYSFMAEEGDGEEQPQDGGAEEGAIQNAPIGGADSASPEMSGELGADGADSANAGQMDGGNEGGVPGFNPQENGDNMGMDAMDMGGSEEMNPDGMQSDDEVIDVDDLTDAQEETEEKVEDIHVTMEKGFEKLLKVVGRLDKMIDASTLNMERIKQEIEKRNPTPIEKLNMRAANDSYPFNISPNDYWKEKEATSNYRIDGENEEDAVQYTITQGDLDNVTDFKRISKELDSDAFNQNLMNIFNLR